MVLHTPASPQIAQSDEFKIGGTGGMPVLVLRGGLPTKSAARVYRFPAEAAETNHILGNARWPDTHLRPSSPNFSRAFMSRSARDKGSTRNWAWGIWSERAVASMCVWTCSRWCPV